MNGGTQRGEREREKEAMDRGSTQSLEYTCPLQYCTQFRVFFTA